MTGELITSGANPVVKRVRLLADRIGEDPREVADSASARGLDSLDFVVLLTVVQDEFGHRLAYPAAELQEDPLSALVAGLVAPICACAAT
mgnify:CR=1 FL=1